MASFELLDTRRISGRGVLKVPPAALEYRYYTMFVDLLRRPSNPYGSTDWNPTKALYARMAFRRDEYVVFDDTIDYEKQQFTYVNDISGQTLIAVKCAYEGILQSFVNLVTGLGGTPGGVGIFVTGVENKIADFKTLALGWDEVLFRCYSDTALLIRFYGANYDKCNPEEDEGDNPPPPPPPEPPLPPGTPINNLSTPYDPDTNDDGNTNPFPSDNTLDLPFGIECTVYDVSVRVTTFTNELIDLTFRLFGEIDGAGIGGGGAFVFIRCRGGRDSLDPVAPECLEVLTNCAVFGSTEPSYSFVEILDVVPV